MLLVDYEVDDILISVVCKNIRCLVIKLVDVEDCVSGLIKFFKIWECSRGVFWFKCFFLVIVKCIYVVYFGVDFIVDCKSVFCRSGWIYIDYVFSIDWIFECSILVINFVVMYCFFCFFIDWIVILRGLWIVINIVFLFFWIKCLKNFVWFEENVLLFMLVF